MARSVLLLQRDEGFFTAAQLLVQSTEAGIVQVRQLLLQFICKIYMFCSCWESWCIFLARCWQCCRWSCCVPILGRLIVTLRG
jgi:hypothetical protein